MKRERIEAVGVKEMKHREEEEEKKEGTRGMVGPSGDGAGGSVLLPPFRSTESVVLMVVIVGVLWVAARKEFRLTRSRRWRPLALLLAVKVFATGEGCFFVLRFLR